jgi:hypothetical protein
MLSGVLRWKEARESAGGIWRLLYAQVSLPHPAAGTVTSLISLLMLTVRAWHGL